MTFDQLRLGNRIITRAQLPQMPGIKVKEGVIVEFWYVPSRHRYRMLALFADQHTCELDVEKAHFVGEGFSPNTTTIWVHRQICGLKYAAYGMSTKMVPYVIDGSTIPDGYKKHYIETTVHMDHRWAWLERENVFWSSKNMLQNLVFLRFMGLLSRDQLKDWGQRTTIASRKIRLVNLYKETEHGRIDPGSEQYSGVREGCAPEGRADQQPCGCGSANGAGAQS